MQKIDPEVIGYMEEEHRAQIEEHAQRLKRIKSEVQGKVGEEGTPDNRPYSEVIHEALEDIVKAMQGIIQLSSIKLNYFKT